MPLPSRYLFPEIDMGSPESCEGLFLSKYMPDFLHFLFAFWAYLALNTNHDYELGKGMGDSSFIKGQQTPCHSQIHCYLTVLLKWELVSMKTIECHSGPTRSYG